MKSKKRVLDKLVKQSFGEMVDAAPSGDLDMEQLLKYKGATDGILPKSIGGLRFSTAVILKAAPMSIFIGLSALSFFQTSSLSEEIKTTFEKVHARRHIQNSLEQVHEVFRSAFTQGDMR